MSQSVDSKENCLVVGESFVLFLRAKVGYLKTSHALIIELLFLGKGIFIAVHEA